MIKFKKIEKGNIFTSDFKPFVKNNEISFESRKKIAIIYGPNGTGKTSLIKALASDENTKIEFEYNGETYNSGNGIFHIIYDQNNRNIIEGETKDFFLGDNIRREFELQNLITEERKKLLDKIISSLKPHGISSASSPLINIITNSDITTLIKDISNNKSKGSKFTNEQIILLLSNIKKFSIPNYNNDALIFIQNDILNKDSIIKKIEDINIHPMPLEPHVCQIEENTEAINILNRFHKDQCIVCDTEGIDWKNLLLLKLDNKRTLFDSLNEKIKPIIEKIITFNDEIDPLMIKSRLINAISNGDDTPITELLQEIEAYKEIYSAIVLNDLATLFSESKLQEQVKEYNALIAEKPEITQEDELYIQEIINNSMNKSLTLERDQNKNLKILLSEKEILGKERNSLPLSAGEQNFLSLTFEFLRAKNSPCPFIVIDDPISSFDSIYKNKIIYAIVRILQHKNQIILTHTIDLVRLLDSQYNNCYRLYILNNTEGEENGFIALNTKEQEMMINLEKLLSTFRNDIFPSIQNQELFLISMIPFMRGYANITNNSEIYNQLTHLMHGYKTNKVDIASIYITLFGNPNNVLPTNYEVSVPEILTKTVDGIHILDQTQYPLLDKTLRHSFTYLFLRLMVEKALVEKFSIDTNTKKQLGQIISTAYPNENNIEEIRKRIRLTSKKTLINEFNHFEGNLSIFQPAIDITEKSLGQERTDIVTFVNNL